MLGIHRPFRGPDYHSLWATQRGADHIPQLVSHYQAGQFPFDKLIRFYPFAAINDAFRDSENGTAIKPVLLF
ncbi:hypothetical protein [Sphingobium sp. YR768]|uniref:hypothetical protein n=1 Tax=Sphingobium sp. YR768 TaxID=1884365 RepID=UPI00115F8FA1|nr:hypothetical protein [Sphingobium sp. YR768]